MHTNKEITDRLVDIVFWPIPEIYNWMKRMNRANNNEWFTFREAEEGVINVYNHYVNCGASIHEVDPISKAIALAFALYGQWWAMVLPENYLDEVSKRWQQERQRAVFRREAKFVQALINNQGES